jgi:hypothetical protein
MKANINDPDLAAGGFEGIPHIVEPFPVFVAENLRGFEPAPAGVLAQDSPTNPGKRGPYLLAAVGLKVQSNRILTCLIADQVAVTFGLEVIQELQPVVVAPCLVRLKPFVQFFLRENRDRLRSRGAASGFADRFCRGLFFSCHDKGSSLDEKG